MMVSCLSLLLLIAQHFEDELVSRFQVRKRTKTCYTTRIVEQSKEPYTQHWWQVEGWHSHLLGEACLGIGGMR